MIPVKNPPTATKNVHKRPRLVKRNYKRGAFFAFHALAIKLFNSIQIDLFLNAEFIFMHLANEYFFAGKMRIVSVP